MKRIFPILILLLLGTLMHSAQQKTPSNPFGFEMDEPAGWHPIDKDSISASLKRLDLKEESLVEFLDQNQGTQLLFAYTKFKQDTFNGVNPKIDARVIRIRSPKPPAFNEFKPLAEATLRKIASSFDEQRYIVEPSAVKIGSIEAVYHISEFSIKTQNGGNHRIRSRTYMIPNGSYFFQISYVDEPAKNDLSVEFDNLVSSLKIRN